MNANGPGPPSEVVVAQAVGPPPAPTGLRAAPGNARVTLTWNAPPRTAVIGEYRYSSDGGITWEAIPDSFAYPTRFTVTGLTNGRTYTFALVAVNPNGSSPASASVTATPRGGPPAKPAGLAAEPGDAEVTLTWDDPLDPSISTYQLKQDAAAWADITGSDATTTSHTVSTLANGTSYTLQIRAVNDHDGDSTDDPGPASDAVTVTAGVPAAAPTGLTAAPADGQVTLSWTAVSGTITGYEYTSNALAPTPTWTDVPDGSDAGTDRADETEYAVTSLTNGTDYVFAVRAENSHGPGPASAPVRATPSHPNAPTAPIGLAAMPGDRLVTLSWYPLADAGITQHEYRQSSDGGATWDPDWSAIPDSAAGEVNAAGYTAAPLTNGHAYSFQVRGRDTDGPGQPSAVATARPGPPRQPTGFTVTPGQYRATLAWRDPGNPNITGYQYTHDGGTTWHSIPHSNPGLPNANRFVVEPLEPSGAYRWGLRAMTGAGAGPAVFLARSGGGGGGGGGVAPAPVNTPPQVAQPIPMQLVAVGDTSEPLDLAPYFRDPDGNPLTYAAESEDDAVVTAAAAEGHLTLIGVATGEAVVTVTASDPFGGSVSQTLTVTVTGQASAPPEVSQRILPQIVVAGSAGEALDLSGYFHDPDGDPLTYAAVSYDPGVLVAEVAAGSSELVLRGVAAGDAGVIVTASDPSGGSASQPVAVTVRTGTVLEGVALHSAADRGGRRRERAAGPGAVFPRPRRRPAQLRGGVGRHRRAGGRGGGGQQRARPPGGGGGRDRCHRGGRRPERRARPPDGDRDGADERRAGGGAGHRAAGRGGRRGKRVAGPGAVLP